MNKINKTRNYDYNSLLKEIRPYVSFNYDLRKELKPHERRKIKKYYDVLKELTSHPHQIYRPRNKKNLKKVQEYSRNPTNLKGLKVAIVPNHDDKLKIRIKGDKVIARSDHLEIDNLYFNMKNLAIDARAEVARVIAKRPKTKSFTIMAAEHEIRREFDRGSISEEVEKLQQKYDNHEQWLWGLISYRALNQNTDVSQHLKEKETEAQRIQNERKKRKDQIRYMEKRINEWQVKQGETTNKKERRELQKRIDKFKNEIGIKRSKL